MRAIPLICGFLTFLWPLMLAHALTGAWIPAILLGLASLASLGLFLPTKETSNG